MGLLGHPLVALMVSVALMWTGNGLLHSLLALRMSEEGFATTVAGTVASGYFVGQLLGGLFCGRLIEKVGHVRTFAASAAIVSVCAVAHALYVDPWFWGFLRLVTGVGIALAIMATESWLNGAVANEARGRLLALYIVVLYSGMAAGQQVLNVAPPTSHVPFSIASMLFSLALVPLALAPRAAGGTVAPSRLGFAELYRISPLGIVSAFGSGLLAGAMTGLVPIFGNQIGMSVAEVATLMTAMMAGGLALQYPIGKLSDYFDRRTVIAGTFFASAAVALAMALTYGWAVALLALMVLYGGLNFALYPLAVSHVNDHVDPADLVPASAGILIAASMGSSIGPIVAAFAMSGVGPGGLFHFSAAVSVATGVFALWRMTRRPALPPEEQAPFVAQPGTSPVVAELDPRGEPSVKEEDGPQVSSAPK